MMGKVKNQLENKNNFLLPLAVIVYLVTSYLSVGFYHPDEYYHPVEFALFKAGIIESYKPLFDYNLQIRPWTLSGVFFIITKILQFFSISNPFVIGTVLRGISALVSLFALYKFNKTIKERKFFKTEDGFYKYELISYFSWPIVFMSARTSSDNWGSAFALLAISYLITERKYRFFSNIFLSAVFFGIAFSIRHQIGIMAFSVGVYSLLSRKMTVPKFFGQFALGITLVCSMGFLIDVWGYDSWTFTPWNYLKVNLLDDKISEFGVYPWWHYFYLVSLKLTPFIGVPILLGLTRFIYKRQIGFLYGLLVSAILPFLFFHMSIGHKELRFIYPLLPLSLFVLGLWLEEKKLVKTFKMIVWVNIISIPVACFKPAYSPFLLYQHLWENKGIEEIYIGRDQRGHFPKLEIQSLIRSDLKMIEVESPEEVLKEASYRNEEKTIYFLLGTPNGMVWAEQSQCSLDFISYPLWLLKYNLFNWVDKLAVWSVASCAVKHKVK